MKKKDSFQIRNCTTDFLIFTRQANEDGVEVRVHGETVWLTQRGMAQLFDCTVDISLHLKYIFDEGKLQLEAVLEDFSVTGADEIMHQIK